MIEVGDLVKRYGEVEALRGVSFTIPKGQVAGFLGPNGAGKSTTLKIITCFLRPTSGRILVAGQDPGEHGLEVRSRIGYVPENAPLYHDMTVWDYLAHIGKLRKVPSRHLPRRLADVADRCGLSDMLHRRVGTLSKGYRQRTCLAQALIHDPEILVLDEPTVGLDPNQIVEIRSLIKELGKTRTVLLSSHILPEVLATCDRLLIMNRGRIVADGTPAELEGSGGSGRYTMRFAPGEDLQARIEQALSSIPSVSSVRGAPCMGGDELEVRLVTSDSRDLRGLLMKEISAKQWPLLELRRERLDLEQLFHQLTKEVR